MILSKLLVVALLATCTAADVTGKQKQYSSSTSNVNAPSPAAAQAPGPVAAPAKTPASVITDFNRAAQASPSDITTMCRLMIAARLALVARTGCDLKRVSPYPALLTAFSIYFRNRLL
jgi:hypothetical protein